MSCRVGFEERRSVYYVVWKGKRLCGASLETVAHGKQVALGAFAALQAGEHADYVSQLVRLGQIWYTMP